MQDCPNINKRIKEVAGHYTGGVISRFADTIKVKQQTLNRLFIVDKRTGKYPTATTEILQAISEMYENIDARWLLTGKGQMFIEQSTKITHHEIDNTVSQKEVGRLEGKIEILERELAQNRREKDRLVGILEDTLING